MLLVMVALLPLFGLVTYTSLQSQQASLAGTRDNLLATARLAALRHERSVEGARQILGAIASAPEVKNQVLPQCMGFLKSLHDKYPFYTNLGLLDLVGNLVCHAVNINGARFLGDRYYFRQALATKSFAIGEYIVGRTSGRPSITFAMRLHCLPRKTGTNTSTNCCWRENALKSLPRKNSRPSSCSCWLRPRSAASMFGT